MEAKNPRTGITLSVMGFALILTAAGGFFMVKGYAAQTDIETVPVQVNYPAPELSLTDLDGAPHSLSEYSGEIVLVNLWATWCIPCQEEMPAFQSYYEKHKTEGFIIIAVNDGDPTADVIEFIQNYGVNFPVWLDPTYIATEEAFKTPVLPSSYVIDRNGIVRLSWVGGINQKMLEKYVTPLIKE